MSRNRNTIRYNSLGIKTNRQTIVKKFPERGVNVPKNLNNKLKNKVQIQEITLPKRLYHISQRPISEFKDGEIFYTSFDEFQSLAHGLQIANKREKFSYFTTDNKLYYYVLEPKQRKVQGVIFDKKTRPKKISNMLGMEYTTYNMDAIASIAFEKDPVKKMTKNHITKKKFREGSGDNMIFGQILCKKLPIAGIRNKIDQDEMAFCNPRSLFRVVEKRTINLKKIMGAYDLIKRIKFIRRNNKFEYIVNNSHISTTLGGALASAVLVNYIKNMTPPNSTPNYKRLLNERLALNRPPPLSRAGILASVKRALGYTNRSKTVR